MRTLAAPIVQTMVVVHNTPLPSFDIEGRRDGHGDSGTRFSLTYSAGQSAAPAAVAGAAPGATGSDALPSAAPAAAVEALRAARVAHKPSAMIDSH